MKSLTLINGNDKKYKRNIPKLNYLGEFNEVALKHILDNTGLKFVKDWNNYTVQPTNFKQITALLMTYNFKTQYNDNATIKNTILLKNLGVNGFKVDSICYNCCIKNDIYIEDMNKKDILSL